MKIFDVLRDNKALQLQKELDEQVPRLYDQLKKELESIVEEYLIRGDKSHVTVQVQGIDPKYFLDTLAANESDVYEVEQVNMETYRLSLKTIM